MAYGDDPQQVKSVIQAKMSLLGPKNSIDSITEPLKSLKKDMERNPMPNMFSAVRNLKDRNANVSFSFIKTSMNTLCFFSVLHVYFLVKHNILLLLCEITILKTQGELLMQFLIPTMKRKIKQKF